MVCRAIRVLGTCLLAGSSGSSFSGTWAVGLRLIVKYKVPVGPAVAICIGYFC